MRFNMSVNKDLGGAICMIKGWAFRQLRQHGPTRARIGFLDHLKHHIFDLHPVP
jgi:hypothetical protein